MPNILVIFFVCSLKLCNYFNLSPRIQLFLDIMYNLLHVSIYRFKLPLLLVFLLALGTETVITCSSLGGEMIPYWD